MTTENSGEINQTYLSVNHFEIWHGHRLRRNSRERKRKEIERAQKWEEIYEIKKEKIYKSRKRNEQRKWNEES